MPQDPAKMPKPGQRPRGMRKKTHLACLAIANKGRTVKEAAQEAGMNESALYRALARPDVAQYLESLKALYILEIDGLRKTVRAEAILTGRDLMANAKSEAVRARMVEFFASEDKKSPTVTIQNNINSGGYAYAPPGARVVDIEDAETVEEGGTHDTQSGDESQ